MEISKDGALSLMSGWRDNKTPVGILLTAADCKLTTRVSIHSVSPLIFAWFGFSIAINLDSVETFDFGDPTKELKDLPLEITEESRKYLDSLIGMQAKTFRLIVLAYQEPQAANAS